MMVRLPSKSSSGMVTPLMPTGAPRSNAISTDAGSPERMATPPRADARSPEAAVFDRQRDVPLARLELALQRHVPPPRAPER
jgi:hypothetical protein